MGHYYRRRAVEYEEIYHRDDPKRRDELEKIASALRDGLADKDVLEVACGTGYWTQLLSRTARSITAVDIAEEMLDIAKMKTYSCPVRFQLGDAFSLPPLEGRPFGGGLANFWLSHIPHSRFGSFVEGFRRQLRSGATVFIADNVYVPGVGGELVRKEGEEDTYKLRELKDGSTHLVLKNYYSRKELLSAFGSYGVEVKPEDVFYGECYWFLNYQV